MNGKTSCLMSCLLDITSTLYIYLCVEELCDREMWVTFVIPTRGRGKHGEGLTSAASVWVGAITAGAVVQKFLNNAPMQRSWSFGARQSAVVALQKLT